MDSLKRKKLVRILAIAGAFAALAGLVAVSVLTPDENEREAEDFTRTVLDNKTWKAAPEEQEHLREQWRRFSPETRQLIFTEVARERLQKMRERMVGLTAEQRRSRISDAIAQMRQRREQISPDQRVRMRERVDSEEGREMVTHVLGFYQTELTATERAELDPLVHEWLRQLEWGMR